MFIDFREIGREREKKKHRRERKTKIGCLPYLGMEPTTEVCTLTGNRTHKVLVYGMILQPTEPLDQLTRFLILNSEKEGLAF